MSRRCVVGRGEVRRGAARCGEVRCGSTTACLVGGSWWCVGAVSASAHGEGRVVAYYVGSLHAPVSGAGKKKSGHPTRAEGDELLGGERECAPRSARVRALATGGGLPAGLGAVRRRRGGRASVESRGGEDGRGGWGHVEVELGSSSAAAPEVYRWWYRVDGSKKRPLLNTAETG